MLSNEMVPFVLNNVIFNSFISLCCNNSKLLLGKAKKIVCLENEKT